MRARSQCRRAYPYLGKGTIGACLQGRELLFQLPEPALGQVDLSKTEAGRSELGLLLRNGPPLGLGLGITALLPIDDRQVVPGQVAAQPFGNAGEVRPLVRAQKMHEACLCPNQVPLLSAQQRLLKEQLSVIRVEA